MSRMIGNNSVDCSYNYRRTTVVHFGDLIVVILLNPGSCKCHLIHDVQVD